MSKATSATSVWSVLDIHEGRWLGAEIGPMRLWLHRSDTDAFLHYDLEGSTDDLQPWSATDERPPEAATMLRVVHGRRRTQLHCLPALPDRPVVIRPEVAMTIPPGDDIQTFVILPLWVRLVDTELPKAVYVDEAVNRLSKTWFGTPESGELAYALHTRARRTMDDLDVPPWRVVCPIRIRNASAAPLHFERLCLRVAHLSIYQGASHLWTNETAVVNRGDEGWSRVVFGQSAPRRDEAGTLLSGPRNILHERLVTRAFGYREREILP